jgi:hypothetical protein
MPTPFVYDPNADIEERCQIYLGRHKETKLFTRGILSWFHSSSVWREHKKPSDEDVRKELMWYIENRNPWTDKPNDADCWDGYWIDKLQRFLPEIEWRKAIITTVPLDKD